MWGVEVFCKNKNCRRIMVIQVQCIQHTIAIQRISTAYKYTPV